jgi:hypothetical protein
MFMASGRFRGCVTAAFCSGGKILFYGRAEIYMQAKREVKIPKRNC